jgi:hypothetical protein
MSTAETVTAWVGAGVVAATLLLGPGLIGDRGEEGPAPAPTGVCPANSEDDVYMSQFLRDWYNQNYPGVTHMTDQDQHIAFLAGVGEANEAEVQRLWDTGVCNDLINDRDAHDALILSIPYDPPANEEGPSVNEDGDGGGGARCRVGFGTGGFHWSCSMST